METVIEAESEFVTDEQRVESSRKRDLICEAAEELKAHNITVLDVQGQTIVADYFIVCSGTSITHIQSIAEGVRDRLRERAHLRAKPEGDAASYWVILDFSDVLMHIFDEETREFYDLERLWADAKVSHYENGALKLEEKVAEELEETSTELSPQENASVTI